MKTKLVAAAAGLLCASSGAWAQSGVTIYGVTDAGYTYVDNNAGSSRTSLGSGIWQSSRIGFRGAEDLGAGLEASFTLEAGINLTSGAGGGAGGALAFTRQSFVGLKGGWGTVTLGRQYDFLFVNVLPLSSEMFVGGLASGTAGGPGGTAGSTNILDVHFGGVRHNSAIKWVKPLGPVTVGLMYGDGLETTTPGYSNKMSSALLSYKDGPLAVGIAWVEDDYNAASSGNVANRVAAIKATYKLGDYTLLGNYASGSSTNSRATSRPLELGVAYNPSVNLTLGIALGRAEVTNAAGAGTTVSQVNLGAIYGFSKRTSVYAMLGANSSANPAVYRGFVGGPGGATAPSSGASQMATRIGITHRF